MIVLGCSVAPRRIEDLLVDQRATIEDRVAQDVARAVLHLPQRRRDGLDAAVRRLGGAEQRPARGASVPRARAAGGGLCGGGGSWSAAPPLARRLARARAPGPRRPRRARSRSRSRSARRSAARRGARGERARRDRRRQVRPELRRQGVLRQQLLGPEQGVPRQPRLPQGHDVHGEVHGRQRVHHGLLRQVWQRRDEQPAQVLDRGPRVRQDRGAPRRPRGPARRVGELGRGQRAAARDHAAARHARQEL